MKKRWFVPLLFVVALGIVGFGLTGEKAQEVQKMNEASERVVNTGCDTAELNPLLKEAYPGISRMIRRNYSDAGKGSGFVESYDNLRVYTKRGRYAGSYVVFVRYDMKIKDIYTKVPGLGTLYVERSGTGSDYEIKEAAGEEGLQEYVALLSSHEDVQALFEETNAEFEKAVESDALLKEALVDLQDAYEEQVGSR